jgi:hypothetical protein
VADYSKEEIFETKRLIARGRDRRCGQSIKLANSSFAREVAFKRR